MRRDRFLLALLVGWSVLPVSRVAAAPGDGALLPAGQVAKVQEGIQANYDLEHGRAAALFEAMIREDPDDAVGYIFLAKTYWLEELIKKQELSIDRFASSDFFAESPKYMPEVAPAVERRFLRVATQGIEKARARLDRNAEEPAALFLLGLAYQNVASYEASLKRSWWAAFRAGSKTYRYHRDLLRLKPDVYDAYISMGTFEYVTGSLGWSTRWLAFLLGYRGNKEKGRQLLRTTSEHATLVNHYARAVLTLIYTRERRFQDAFDEMSTLLKSFPKNYLVHLDMGGIALLMQRHDAALTIYRDILRKVDAKKDRYDRLEKAAIHNRLGVAFRRKGDLRESVASFRQSLAEEPAAVQTRIVTHLELGKTYDLLGRRAEAEGQYQKVLDYGDFAGSQDEARDLLRRRYARD